MKRKLVKQGPSSLMVSLPIEWINDRGLQKGDEVDVSLDGIDLLVSTKKRLSDKSISLEFSNSDQLYMWRVLQAAFFNGYEEIKVKFVNYDSFSIIQRLVVGNMPGFEVISYDKTSCVIKAIAIEVERDFDVILKKAFQDVLQMSEAFYEFIKGDQKASVMYDLERINNRHSLYLRRLIVQKKENKSPYLFMLVSLLEKIANEFRFFSMDLEKAKTKTDKHILEFYKKIHEQLVEVFDLFSNFSHEKFEKIVFNGIHVEEGKSLFKKSPDFAYYFMKIIDVTRMISFQIINIHYSKK